MDESLVVDNLHQGKAILIFFKKGENGFVPLRCDGKIKKRVKMNNLMA